MAERIDMAASGGCQCGAVRYHATAFIDTSHICHCRMCQKAVGGFFAALVGIPRDAFAWTRGTPQSFASSDLVERHFCGRCGTPLTYSRHASTAINVTTGSLDEPVRFPPKMQFGVEARLPWYDTLASLADDRPTEVTMASLAADIRASNRQHPDHDTQDWPQT